MRPTYDILFLTETWLKPHGDESRLHDLTPAGYIAMSFPRESRGGGIAVVYNKCLSKRISITATFCFHHQSFEVIRLFCVLFLFCFVALLLRRRARFVRAFNCPCGLNKVYLILSYFCLITHPYLK